MHTTIEDEFQLKELQVNEFSVDRFVSQTHPNVFQFNQVALKGIV